jgi:hypothetical protein
VLMSAEDNCDHEDNCSEWMETYFPELVNSPYRYPNSGLFLGRPHHLLELLYPSDLAEFFRAENITKNSSKKRSDQYQVTAALIRYLILKRRNQVQFSLCIDTHGFLLHSLYDTKHYNRSGYPLQVFKTNNSIPTVSHQCGKGVLWVAPPPPVLNTNTTTKDRPHPIKVVDVINTYLCNNITKGQPLVIHANGLKHHLEYYKGAIGLGHLTMCRGPCGKLKLK